MSGVTGSHRTLILLVCCLAQCLGVLDVTIVNVALEPIRADLGLSSAALHWVAGAYALACAGCLLPGGRAADLLGRREVFAAGLGLFGLASVAGGLAQDGATLIAARAGQGAGAAVMAPTSLSILAAVYDAGPERNRAFGLWGTMGATGGAAGALAGGAIASALSWRWTLLATAPVALALAAVALRAIPPLGRRAGAFDLRGAIVVAAAMALLTYGATGGGGAFAVGAALLAAFALIEARARSPLVPPRVLRSRALAGAGAAVFCLGAAAVPMWLLISLHVQRELGFSALQAGLTFAPMSVVIAACTQAASRLAARCGPARVLAVGMTGLGAGLLLLAQADAGDSWAGSVLAPGLLCAAGIGCSFVSTTIAATAAVTRADAGLASGLVNTAFQLGGSIGLATAGGFAGGGAFALAGAGVALALLAGRPRARAARGAAAERV
jgi:MFS family permease